MSNVTQIKACTVPDCGYAAVDTLPNMSPFCKRHQQQFRDIYYALDIVPMFSKAEMIVEIMCLYEMTLRE